MVQIDFNTEVFLSKNIIPPVYKKTGIEIEPTSGIVTEQIGMFSNICKTKISVYKNNILYDISITNNEGYYFLFLENGVYDFKLENEKYTRWYREQKIENGINICYNNIDNSLDYGMIYNIYGDVIEFLDIENSNTDLNSITSEYKLIVGFLIDEYNNPVQDASIIISKNNELISFIKTDKDGYYRFALKPNTYDIRIRHNDYSVKIFNNFIFKQENGFMSELNRLSNDFNFDGQNLKILKGD